MEKILAYITLIGFSISVLIFLLRAINLIFNIQSLNKIKTLDHKKINKWEILLYFLLVIYILVLQIDKIYETL